MPGPFSPNLKQFPFLRLLVALTAGIMFQWYFHVSLPEIFVLFCINMAGMVLFALLSFAKKFIFSWLRGLLWLMLFVCMGMLVTWQQNITNSSKWFQKNYLNRFRINSNHPGTINREK
jgi:hypothetical protein